MTLFRSISFPLHGAIEAFAGPILMVAPFLLGFQPAAAIASVLFGVLLLGNAIWSQTAPDEAMPMATHAAVDYGFALGFVLAGVFLGLAAGDIAATIFLVSAGALQAGLTASTRFSIPHGV